MVPALLVGLLLVLRVAMLAADHVAAVSIAADAARAVAAGVPESVVARRPELAARDARLRVQRERAPGDPAEWVVVEVRLPGGRLGGVGLPDAVGHAAARAQ